MKKEAERSKKKIMSIVITVIVVSIIVSTIIFIVSASISISKGKLVKLFGTSISTVITPSMEPTILVGDMIVIKEYDYSKLKEDDIIVYYSDNYKINIVHRIIEIDDDGIIVKGDNNSNADEEKVTTSNFVGIVTKYGSFLGIGKVVAKGRNIGYVVMIVVLSLTLITEMFNFIQLLQKKKNGGDSEEVKAPMKPIVIDREKMKQELLEEIKRELEEQEKNNKK